MSDPKKPIVLESDGIFGQLRNGELINAGGTSHPTFTVGGRGLLFDDGTSTNPDAGAGQTTLQTVYDNTIPVDNAASIKLISGKDFALLSSDGALTLLRVSATSGDLSVLGETTTDSLVVLGNISLGGTINGVNVQTLAANFASHVAGGEPKHSAADIPVDDIVGLPSGINTQIAIELINNRTSGSLAKGYEHDQPIAGLTWTIQHNLGTRRLQTTVYDENWEQILPDSVKVTTLNEVIVTFSSLQSGRAMIISF